MRESKRMRLEAAGWKVGSMKEFLGLTEQEREYIEVKLRLAASLHDKRKRRHMGQVELARLAGSSQSRIAKMEVADESVSLDLLIRSHIALGATARELGRIIARAR